MHQIFSSKSSNFFLMSFEKKFDNLMKSNFTFEYGHQNVFHQNIRIFKCPFIRAFKMAELAALVALNELIDSDDQKQTRGSTREWVKRRNEKGYFNNIVKELRVEDRFGFREMF